MASIPDLEKIYGPAVLYDEAMAIVVPNMISPFFAGANNPRFGKPEVENVQL